MRTLVAVAVAMTAVATSLATVSVAAPEQQLGLFAYRTTTGAASLRLQVDIIPSSSSPSVVGLVVASVNRGRIEATHVGGVGLFGTQHTQLRMNGQQTVLCDTGVCIADSTSAHGSLDLWVNNGAGDKAPNVVFVVASGASVSFDATLKGWALKRVPLPYRWASGERTSEVGAYTQGSGVEVFTKASAPGGPTGSMAIGIPPCGQASNNTVSRGVGSLTLEGGRTRPTFSCPQDRGALVSWADRPTTWLIHGQAAGEMTMADVRLFIIDLPKKLPIPVRWPWN